MSSSSLKAFLSLLCAIVICPAARPLRAHEPPTVHRHAGPNVILFLADDLGYGDLGCHGNPQIQTPHIDSLAEESVELSQFRVSPMCSPTRASLMTGRYNFRTGVYTTLEPGSELDPGETTMADCLRAAGYKTGIFGKWHLGTGRGYTPNDRGFDESLSFSSWNGAGLLPSYNDPVLLRNGKSEKHTGYCMDIFTNEAIRFMRENRERPFFIYLPTNLIHTPLQISEELAAEYDSAALGDDVKKVSGMIRSVDQNLGRLRAALRDLGLEKNTLFIFTSDNGASEPVERPMAGLHGMKGMVYENGLRVPCFARWPNGFKGPARVTQPAAHIDILPTVLDACCVEKPAGVRMDGISLLPTLRNPTTAHAERTLFFQQTFAGVPERGSEFAVLSGNWKLVQPCGGKNRWSTGHYGKLCRIKGIPLRSLDYPPRYELYDILADPGESRDVASQHPDLVLRMRRQYDEWFSDTAARWLQTDPAP